MASELEECGREMVAEARNERKNVARRKEENGRTIEKARMALILLGAVEQKPLATFIYFFYFIFDQ